MKCATSTLHDQLARQPGILMSTPKEPCFFSDDDQYGRGMDWYAHLFASAASDDLCGESSTHYSKLPTYPATIKRLKADVPDAKLVYIMRHPIDRLISQYIHEWTTRKLRGPIDRAIDQLPRLVDYSRYAMQLRPLLKAFGQQQVLPVLFERLMDNPQSELERIARFIGYAGQPQWQVDVEASNVSLTRERASGWRDALVYAPGISAIRQRYIPQSWRDRLKTLWQMRQRPQISPDRLQRLRRIFDEDLKQLGPCLGMELSCDTFKQCAVAQQTTWRTTLPPQDNQPPAKLVVGAVAIGRNEGSRLERCLRSLSQKVAHIVYVDSGSTDGSMELARSLGIQAIELDTRDGFSMARGRNAGFAVLLERNPEIDAVQFVDGDCEIVEQWIDDGCAALLADEQVAVVSGRRRERERGASRYNRLADMEWDTPIGVVKSCHGDALIRVQAFNEVGGFNPMMICGEEPEMCVRLRQRGWVIQRIDRPMSLHDAAMYRFSQWWNRSVRGGWAFAEGAAMHGQAPERHWVRESMNVCLYGAVLPVICIGLAWWTYALSLLLLVVIYGRHVIKVYRDRLRHGDQANDAWLYALFATLGKFPAALGQARYYLARWRGGKATLIEYKVPAGKLV
jgi:hypothetical protein